MSVNKNALLRYRTLDKCFRNPHRNYSIMNLVEACNEALRENVSADSSISKEMVYRDITFMQSDAGGGAPIIKKKEGKYVYYLYEDRNFSIDNRPLNEAEENQLTETLSTLSRFKGMVNFEWVNEIITRLESDFKIKNKGDKVIEFEQNPYLEGLGYISDLYHAIIYKKVVKLTYRSFKQKSEVKYVFHPYYLKQYNSRWYTLGQANDYPTLSNFSLDRIIGIEELKSETYRNISNEIILEDYFQDVVGVTIPEDKVLEKVLLKIDPKLIPYVKSKPIHESQTKLIFNPDGTATTKLNVIINYELITQLFAFGNELRVEEPQHLREKLVERAKQLLEHNHHQPTT